MTYEKVTVHTKTGEFIATFNDTFKNIADVRRKVRHQCQGMGTVEVTVYREGHNPKSFNMKMPK